MVKAGHMLFVELAVASTFPTYDKILDEEPEIETDVEAVEIYEEY